MIKRRLLVSYAQLAVFGCDLQNPFNDWSDKHVNQGFSWRPESVSFRSLVEFGMHSISVAVVDQLEPLDAFVVRAVQVPFIVPESGCIEIASISDSISLSLKSGSYLLRCEFLTPASDGDERVRLIFSTSDPNNFAVVRSDPGLKVDGELVMSSEPASTDNSGRSLSS